MLLLHVHVSDGLTHILGSLLPRLLIHAFPHRVEVRLGDGRLHKEVPKDCAIPPRSKLDGLSS